MDAAKRRRELRKRKILQNAEDRIKKLTGSSRADEIPDEGIINNVVLASPSKSTEPSSCKDDGNADSLSNVTNMSEMGEIESSTEQGNVYEAHDYTQKKTDSRNKLPMCNETRNRFNHKTTEIETDQIFSAKDCEPCEIKENNANHHLSYETTSSQHEKGNEPKFDLKTSNMRCLVVMLYATLCFLISLRSYFVYFIADVLGFPLLVTSLIEQQFSFIGPFCIFELCLYFGTSMRKVLPGKRMNIWLLGLQLSGVSSKVLEVSKTVMTQTLEFFTDLALFIFTLTILGSLNNLKSNNVS